MICPRKVRQTFRGHFMYIKHTFSERLLSVQRYLSGDPCALIARELGLRETDIPIYVALYNKYGELGLHKQPNVRASYRLKLQVVDDYQEHLLSLADIVVKYGVSRASVHRWCQMARTKGHDSLSLVKLRGRPPKDMSKQSNPKEPLTELERLQAEVRYLRAENDLLKKVKALVEQREVQNRKIGHKPSKN